MDKQVRIWGVLDRLDSWSVWLEVNLTYGEAIERANKLNCELGRALYTVGCHGNPRALERLT